MAGAPRMVTIKGVVTANAGSKTALERKSEAAGEVRNAFFLKAEKERSVVKALMEQYDEDKSGALNKEQLTKMLGDYSMSQFGHAGPPTDADLDILINLCDRTADGEIANVKEVIGALDVWFAYIEKGDEIKKFMDKFDVNKSGQINKGELKPLLTELNGGKEVPDDVLVWVWEVGDILGNGQMNALELTRAVAAWYAWSSGVNPLEHCGSSQLKSDANPLTQKGIEVPADVAPKEKSASCACTVS